MKIANKEHEVKTVYSNDELRRATIISYGDGFYIDFYYNDVLIDSYNAYGQSLKYSEDMANSFIDGIIGIDRKTWRINGI